MSVTLTANQLYSVIKIWADHGLKEAKFDPNKKTWFFEPKQSSWMTEFLASIFKDAIDDSWTARFVVESLFCISKAQEDFANESVNLPEVLENSELTAWLHSGQGRLERVELLLHEYENKKRFVHLIREAYEKERLEIYFMCLEWFKNNIPSTLDRLEKEDNDAN